MAPAKGTDTPGSVAALVLAHLNGEDIETALDRTDVREVAVGATWLLAQEITLSGKSVPDYFASLRTEIISAHLRRPPLEEV